MINFKKQDPVADAVKEILQQEALKGNQTKIDKNHNGKIDGQDFKILRGEKKETKKEVAEETVEEGLKDVAKKAFKALTGGSDKDQLKDLQRKMNIPQTGKKPSDKSLGEEVEQIDELSKSTLGSYVKTAARDATVTRKIATDFEHKADRAKNTSTKGAATRLSDKFNNMSNKRHAGIGKAVERLTKEENKLDEVAPPGFEGTVKAMKKHKDIDNPWALAWSMKNKGYKSHKKADGSAKNEEVEVPTQKTLKQFKEGWDDMLKAVKERNKPQPNGGSGVKQGTRYGGSKQKDEPEKDTDEKK